MPRVRRLEMLWWRRRQREDELERELRSHLEMEAAEQKEYGLPAGEAGSAARRALGNTTLLKEDVRAGWGGAAMERTFQDVKYASRTLRKSPGFTAATVFTLALGIGANSAVFSIVDGVLLKPLPFERASRLVAVYARDAQGQRQFVSQPDLDDWRTSARAFSGLASWVPQSINLTGLEQPERISGLFVSANFFSVLGVTPAIGRSLATGEDRPGGERVAIISDRIWHTRFGADPATLNKTAEFNGEPYTIIGILPASYVFPVIDADVYLPAFKYPNYSLDRRQSSGAVIGRLRDGASIETAQAEMNTIMARLAGSYPVSNKGRGALVVSFKDDLIADLTPSLVTLSGAVAFVLLIGCANVASLFIARMVSRERERAVRVALGASRTRLISHLLAEAALLAAAGGGLGLLLGVSSVPAIAASIAQYLPYGTAIQLDRSVVLFTVGLSLATAFLVAVIPAFQGPVPDALRAGRGAGSGARNNRARSILVAAEIALAMVLLVGAGLMIRSFTKLGRTDPGFDTRNLLTLAYRVPRNKYPTGEQQNQFHSEVVARIEALPGVLGATSVRAVPLGGNGNSGDFLLADQPEPSLAQRPQALLNYADPGFFSTMRIRLLAGRVFNEHDRPGGTYVVVVNRTLVSRYFDGHDPIGRRLRIPSIDRTAEIVGVVDDVKQFTLKEPPTPQIYGALAQNPFIFTSLAVRTAGDPLKMVNQIRRAIWKVDKDQPVWSIHTFDEILQTQSHLRELLTGILGAYAAVALVLASIGIFGVISYTVSQRTPEIGVRIAVGAQPADVVRLVLRHALWMVLAGIAAGLCAAVWLSRYLRTQLYQVSPFDGQVYGTVVALLAVVALAASILPALRATRVDPVVALRNE